MTSTEHMTGVNVVVVVGARCVGPQGGLETMVWRGTSVCMEGVTTVRMEGVTGIPMDGGTTWRCLLMKAATGLSQGTWWVRARVFVFQGARGCGPALQMQGR